MIRVGFCSAACCQTFPCVLNCSTESFIRVDQSHKAGMTLHSLFTFGIHVTAGCPATGKVIIGVVIHWPCITDSVVYPRTGSVALVRWAPGAAWPIYPYSTSVYTFLCRQATEVCIARDIIQYDTQARYLTCRQVLMSILLSLTQIYLSVLVFVKYLLTRMSSNIRHDHPRMSTLIWWHSYANVTRIRWRCTGCARMNFLHQGFWKLSYYSLRMRAFS